MEDERKNRFFVSESPYGETRNQKYARWEKERLAKIEEEKNNREKLTYNWLNGSEYKVTVSSYVTLGDGKINETVIDRVWLINYFPEKKQFSIEETEHTNVKIDSQLKDVYKITDYINKAVKSMIFTLNDRNTINSVANIPDILKIWENVKFEDIKQFGLLKEGYRQMTEIYDKQFRNLPENVKLNLLYQLFLYPFGGLLYPEKELSKLSENQTVSILFPGEIVEYDTLFHSNVQENKIIIHTLSRKKVQDHKNLLMQYQEKYEKVLNEAFDYNFFIEGKYTHSPEGVMEKAIVYFKEKVNDKMQYVSKYEYYLINKTENLEP